MMIYNTLKVEFRIILYAFGLLLLLTQCTASDKTPSVKSSDGQNEISLLLNENGEISYEVKNKDQTVIRNSSLGLLCDDHDFTQGLTITEISPVEEQRETYQLIVSHQKNIDQLFKKRSVFLENSKGAKIVIDLIAGNEGVAFRYRFPESSDKVRIVEKEITEFRIEQNGKAWLQPYNKAGKFTPGYEDFYFNVNVGDTIKNPRNESVGWCMPALFNVNNESNWLLIAESGTDGSFCGCHLSPDSEDGIYKIALAKDDELVKIRGEVAENANPRYTLPWTMPWRAIIIGDNAGEIMLSTMITDLAPESKIDDTSWIKGGKASWAWWSHGCDDLAKTYNDFTDLAADFNWKYTLFDAKWERANRDSATLDYTISKGIKPWVWSFSGIYYDAEKRRKTLKKFKALGVVGVKIDFWCSDRQEAISAMHSVFEEAAKEQLMINLHGSTVPRGWHRTWPNFVTAEAVLGAEHYFYQDNYPELAAEQNTVLPFTRNVAGPTDYTPVALTIRKFPRLNTAVHELATAMIYTSGVINFADSDEMFESLPEEIKKLLKEMPATWDNTECIAAEPGKVLILSRQKDDRSYIVGINGTDKALPIEIDLKKYSNFSNFSIISEGEDPLMDFAIETFPIQADWSHVLAPRGGFIIQFANDKK